MLLRALIHRPAARGRLRIGLRTRVREGGGYLGIPRNGAFQGFRPSENTRDLQGPILDNAEPPQALFGALVVQLALTISRTDGLALCSGCGLSYVPSRRPRDTKRRYCPEYRKRKVPGQVPPPTTSVANPKSSASRPRLAHSVLSPKSSTSPYLRRRWARTGER
jgi:hypothetical protein